MKNKFARLITGVEKYVAKNKDVFIIIGVFISLIIVAQLL